MGSEARPRAREAGVVVGLLPPGPLNAITDVEGVRVGHATVWHGEARTGVSVVVPHPGNLFRERLFAGSFVLNGYGEIVSRSIVDEWGLLGSPIYLTNSMSLGAVYDAAARLACRDDPDAGVLDVVMPVVGECDDGYLSDIRGFHVGAHHVEAALRGAADGPVQEGAVGAGTGMACFELKGGIGTASRVAVAGGRRYVVGALVLTNFGERPRLSVKGVEVGRQLDTPRPLPGPGGGSCIVVIGTDAPLHPQQLRRLAKRGALGLARTGSTGADGSGELMLAFSTATRVPRDAPGGTIAIDTLLSGGFRQEAHPLDELFAAAVEATEEAVLNALFRATTVVGRDGHVLHELPIERTLELLHRAGVLG